MGFQRLSHIGLYPCTLLDGYLAKSQKLCFNKFLFLLTTCLYDVPFYGELYQKTDLC